MWPVFASKKMLQQHRQIHRKNKGDPPGAPIIDHLVVPRRIVIRLGNEVLVITGDHPDGEAADWVNVENILLLSNTKTFRLIVFKVFPT